MSQRGPLKASKSVTSAFKKTLKNPRDFTVLSPRNNPWNLQDTKDTPKRHPRGSRGHPDAPRGFMHFERVPLATQMEADFDTGNMRFKARERYSFGFSDPRCVFGSKGA